MKLEETLFVDSVGLYELKQYANAKKKCNAIKIELDYAIEELYDDCSPSITQPDYELGLCYVQSTPVEKMALLIIDTKERYRKMIERQERKAQLFDAALMTLTPRERDVIRVYYYGRENNLGLTEEYFSQILQEAQDKLCYFLIEEQINKRNEWNRLQKLERLKKAQQLKNAM